MKTRKQGIRTTLFAGMLLAGQGLLLYNCGTSKCHISASSKGRRAIPAIVLTLTLICMMFPAGALAWPGPYGHSESYFNYLGNYPYNQPVTWAWRSQGLAHNEDHWFITQTFAIWKIPVTQDLVTVRNQPPVRTLHISDAGLPSDYQHFGDPDYYKYEGTGYLIVPVEDDGDGHKDKPAIAIFRASDLYPVGYALLPQPPEPFNEIGQTGWVAVDNQGHIYSADPDDTYYTEYQLNWAEVRWLGAVPEISRVKAHPFLDEEGNEMSFDALQGGEFGDTGRLLYISAGHYFGTSVNDGINVFDTQTHRRVAYSSKSTLPFKYDWGLNDEPEGLTIWDLDGRDVPGGLEGQLHVLLNNVDATDPDIYMKHYTHTITVDRNYTGSAEEGTPSKPFNTVGEANNYAWNGAKIKVKAGPYPENLTITKQVEVVQDGGSVTIGE